MKTKLLIIDRGQLGILTDTLKYCEYLHCHFNITYICFDEHRKKIEIPQVKIIMFLHPVENYLRMSVFS